jgi:uncharacterized protein with von Willebrand factor type A (vWA) domain
MADVISGIDSPAARGGYGLLARLVGFTRFVRENGFQVGIQESLDAARLAADRDLLDSQLLRWGLRSLLCTRRKDWEAFDALFDAYWWHASPKERTRRPGRAGAHALHPGHVDGRRLLEAASGATPAQDADLQGGRRGGASVRETIARADFGHLADADDMRALEVLVERLARNMRRRTLRRLRIHRAGPALSLRHTIRRSLRYGGVPFELAFRQRRLRRPKLVMLLDVSGSMNLYGMLFLRFARCLVQALGRVEVFVFHTRLVRVTDALRERDPERFVQSLQVMSAGWSGGTRIGAALEEFSGRFAMRMLVGRPAVVIMSDGLDAGAPEQLAAALAQVKRRARRLVWLNPLLGREGYQPLARGMRTALPYLDVFAPAHSLDSLAALELYLTGL